MNPNPCYFRTHRGGMILFRDVTAVRRNLTASVTELRFTTGTMSFNLPDEEHAALMGALEKWATGL